MLGQSSRRDGVSGGGAGDVGRGGDDGGVPGGSSYGTTLHQSLGVLVLKTDTAE